MLRVGNDVVDLTDEEARPEGLHPRFDERVFNLRERERIAASSCPNRTRWSLWAAKESAYKLAKKLDPDTAFIPVQFATEETASGVSEVCYRNRRYPAAVINGERWVHAVAVCVTRDSGNRPPGTLRVARCGNEVYFLQLDDVGQVSSRNVYAAIRPCIGTSQDSAGIEVRRLAYEVVGGIFNIDSQKLDLTKENKIPRLRRDGVALCADLSLSHHGQYVAFAYNQEA